MRINPLEKLRLDNGYLTKVSLAREIGLADGNIGKLEHNDTYAGLKTLAKYAEFFGIDELELRTDYFNYLTELKEERKKCKNLN